MTLNWQVIPVLMLCLVATAENKHAVESRDSITAKIESGDVKAMNRWVQLSCVGSYKVTTTPAKLDPDEDHLVAVVTSVGCDQLGVIVFSRVHEQQNAYIYEDGIRLSSFYGQQPKFQYPELATPGIQEILINGVVTDTGSGVLQRDCLILKLLNKRLATVFRKSELVRFSQKNASLAQKSTFVVRDSKAFNMAGNKFLQEEQTVSFGGRSIARTRNCFWEENLRHFTCVEGSSDHSPSLH